MDVTFKGSSTYLLRYSRIHYNSICFHIVQTISLSLLRYLPFRACLGPTLLTKNRLF
nr:MAG TPA: hypothetical protein [Caudoviricetes sp.]